MSNQTFESTTSQHEDTDSEFDAKWAKIRQLSEFADARHAEWANLDRQAKAAKKEWESSVEQLQEAIRDLQQMPRVRRPLLPVEDLEEDSQELAACPPPEPTRTTRTRKKSKSLA
jgi:hypothetical protein